MNVLFLGRFFPQKLLSTVIDDSHGEIEFSNHNFEMSLIHGLMEQEQVTLRCVSVPAVYSFPLHNRKPFTRSEHYQIDGCNFSNVSFCNMAGWHKLSILMHATRHLTRELRQFTGDTVYCLVVPPRMELLDPLFRAARRSKKQIVTTLVVPDVPSVLTDMRKQHGIRQRLLHWMDQRTLKLSYQCDHYVLLTDSMKECYPDKTLHYMVMEGLIDTKHSASIAVQHDSPNAIDTPHEIILYTGAIQKQFGVLTLIDAFEQSHLPDAELWLCGSGDGAETIRQRADANPRIHYLGLVNAQEARKLQQKATILVNPRSSQEEYTRYSFPSKTIEYLMSGKSVIINRLPGIPEEYYDFVYLPHDESALALAATLRAVAHEPREQRNSKATAGRQFVISHKSAQAQVKRILDFINPSR